MKYISIILNVILAIAVVVLYVFHFSSGDQTETPAGQKADSLKMPEDITIAYILEDSLLSNYAYFQELAAGLEKKRDDMENDYTLKAEGLQKEIEGFQRTAGNMTMNQARAVEEDLLRKRQNLMVLQERMSQDLMAAEMDVNNKLYDKVTDYIDNYARDKGYELVLNVKRGNAVLYGHQGMNITQQIIDGLNREYNNPGTSGRAAGASDSTLVK